MIRELILPQLAMGMSEGTIVEWAVAEGALVQKEQLLVCIETEKVTTDLPSPYAGYVHHIAKPGDVCPVDTAIGQIAETEDEYRTLSAAATPAAAAAPTVRGARAVATAPATAVAGPVDGSAPGLRTGKVRASGLAKATARRENLDLSSLAGSGPEGRIVRRDVVVAIEARSSIASAPRVAPVESTGTMRERVRIPLTGMRKAIAERMVAAKTTAAHTYAFFEADITKLLAARQTMLDREKELGTRVSLNTLLVRAVAIACRRVPICNATLNGDTITVWDNVNVGVAVALPGKGEYDSGLIVPVLRNVEGKGLLEIDREMKSLAARARNGELMPGELADGTITVSSTSGFAPGLWAVSTPLLNLPQAVNFQPGSPLEKPIVVDGHVAVRSMLPCGLSFDHRIVDGAPVGRFVQALTDLLAHPELMLL